MFDELMSLKIGEIMTKDVVKIEGDITAREVAVIMNEREIGCVIVVQGDDPIGIITEKDMIARILLGSRDPETTKAFQIMTSPLFLGNPNMSIQDVVQFINEKNIKRLPIVDDKGHLVGMMTLTDLIRSVAYLEHIFSKVGNSAKR